MHPILARGNRLAIYFGLWVLVHHFQMDVPTISGVLLAVTALSMVAGTWIGRMVDRHGERRMLALVNVAYVVALLGYGLVDNLFVALLCYVIYSFIMPLSSMGASVYLRKVAAEDEIAPSLAMGITMQHFAAIAVPVAAGFILNYVGYQVPFLVAALFASATFVVTRRLSPETQKSPQRKREEAGRLATARA